MPTRFVTPKDFKLFNTISEELVEDIIGTPVELYKMIVEDNEVNMYGESPEKRYYLPIQLDAMITRTDESTTNTDFGTDTVQPVSFAFQRERMKTRSIYPEVGDIVGWNSGYYEIHNVNENQLSAGRVSLNYSFVCETHLTRRSKVQIEDIRFGDNI